MTESTTFEDELRDMSRCPDCHKSQRNPPTEHLDECEADLCESYVYKLCGELQWWNPNWDPTV